MPFTKLVAWVFVGIFTGMLVCIPLWSRAETVCEHGQCTSENSIIYPAQWTDLRAPLDRIVGLGTDPDFIAFRGNTRALHFDPNTDEEAFFTVQLPHAYKLGTDLLPHIHWTPTNTNTGTVRWCLEYSLAERDEVYGASTTTLCVSAAGSGTAYQHQVAPFGTIDGTALDTISATIVCRVYRDANDVVEDTYDADAAGLEVDFHYLLDTAGSSQTFAK